MKRAFTLTELLVITGLVAVVSTILFPNLKPKKSPDHLSRFMKVASGVLQYSADNDDRTPPHYGTTFGSPGNQYHNTDTWVGRIYPYVRNRSAFFDPTTSEPKPTFQDADGDLNADAHYGSKAPTDHYTYRWQWITSISLNADGFAEGGEGSCQLPIRYCRQRSLGTIDRPEGRLMLAPTHDGANRFGWNYFQSYEAMRPDTLRPVAKEFSWFNMVWNARARWSGRMGAAFADGHVGRFGQEMFVLYPKIKGRAEYCEYLKAHPKLPTFWGEFWSMH